MVTLEQVRAYAETLPRTEVALVRDRVKFRIRQIVYLAFSRDETLMGFAFPREEREALVASEPNKFQLPIPSELRWNWCVVRTEAIDEPEMRQIVFHAWKFCVPKRVATDYVESLG